MNGMLCYAMPTSSSSSSSSWLSTWRNLGCKTQEHEVHDPNSTNKRTPLDLGHRSGCSRSIANLRDVIHSSRRIESGLSSSGSGVATNFSPKSVESNDFVQSISHEAILKSHLNHSQQLLLQPPFNSCKGGSASHHQALHEKLSLDDIVANYYVPSHGGARSDSHKAGGGGGGGSFYGTPLHPTTSSHSSHHINNHSSPSPNKSNYCASGNSLMKLSGCYDCQNPAVSLVVYKTGGASAGVAACNGGASSAHPGGGYGALPAASLTTPVCRRCGEVFARYEALEKHHLLKHLVTELGVGDSSRNVVEIIFRTSWLKADREARSPWRCSSRAIEDSSDMATAGGPLGCVKIDKVFKVNNLARTVARFEAYREGVKSKASRLAKKHPRCLADGNELLRFYGARLECEFGGAGSCGSTSCSVCRILRCGFAKTRSPDGSNRGILTTATSGRAHDIQLQQHHHHLLHRNHSRNYTNVSPPLFSDANANASSSSSSSMAMLVCRVIAGRIHKPPPPDSSSSSVASAVDTSAFDSVAGGDAGSPDLSASSGLHSRFEELTVFTPRAILPCFVVLYSAAAAGVGG